jgi:N-acetylmuramoyl-L-alanine amidase
MRTTGRVPHWFKHLAVLSLMLAPLCISRDARAFNPCECGGTPTAVQIDVWLDPGHDSLHKGNAGLNLPGHPREEAVTWEVTNDLSNELLNAGYCALLTRVHFDTKYSPRQRAGIAGGLCMNDNSDQAIGQAMVSVHTNSGPPDRIGTYTVYPSVKSCSRHANTLLDDQAFATDLQNAMAPQMRLAYVGACSALPCSQDLHTCPSNSPCSPGVKSAIEEAIIPAVIVEVGYQTNTCQECAMRVQPGVIAQAVAAGVYNTFITPTACVSAKGQRVSAGPTKPATHPVTSEPQRVASKESAKPNTTLSFSEGFEGGTFPPSGWSLQTSGAPSPYAWARTTSSFYVATGSGAAFIGGGYMSAKDEYLISPAVVLGAGDTGLQFKWIGNRNFSGEVDLQVLARPSSGGSWTALWTLSSQPYGNAFTAKTATASLNAFAGQSIQLGFRAFGTNGADFSVDDVAVGTFQVSQPPSNDLCANAAQLPSGVFSLTGSTCNGANNMDPSSTANPCIGYDMDGPDVFYHFRAGVGDTLTASVHALWGAGVYLMPSCSATPSDCMAGAYFEDSDLDPTISVVFPSAGQYVLAVDGPGGACGDFQLSGRLAGPTVGVEPGIDQGRGIQVTPNPMSSRAAIVGTFRRAVDGQAQLTITDVQGRQVVNHSLPLSRGRVTWQWDRSSSVGKRVQPGMYLVELRHKDEILQSRVVVRD